MIRKKSNYANYNRVNLPAVEYVLLTLTVPLPDLTMLFTSCSAHIKPEGNVGDSDCDAAFAAVRRATHEVEDMASVQSPITMLDTPQYIVSTLTNPSNVVYTPAPLPASARTAIFDCQLTLPFAVVRAYMYRSRELTYKVAESNGFTSADAATDPPV